MYSLRKWIFRPKRTDSSYLAQFFHSDEELNMVASELDSFDGRKDPERCNALVNQLRMCQDKVLTIVEKIMDEVIEEQRANRDFRVKFPDDVLQESLAGQLWFGAECLAAGSSIMNREVESASMRPLAKALTRHLDYLRSLLRDQCLRNHNSYTDKIKEGLAVFDKLFAEFELSYVSAMVPVKTMKEYDILQEVIVLFSETTQRAMKLNLLTQDMLDDYDPALMFTIPRLAIICGLLIYPEGPLNPDMDPMNMSEMFRPFQTLLYKIRELLWTLSREELWLLEKALCSAEEPGLYRNYDPVTFQEDCDLADIPDWYYPPNLSSKTEASIGETLRTRLHRDNPFTGQLGADILEAAYGSMSQSPSVQTIVSNPNYRNEGDTLSESTLEESEGASGQQVDDGTLKSKALLAKQHSADSSTNKDSGSANGQTETEFEGATASATDTRSLRHSLSWPESTRRGRTGRMSEGETQILNYDADSLEEDNMVDPDLHLTASTHEFNFHLPLNTERVRPESSEHEYDIPTVSAKRMTPSGPTPGGVTNLQRIFITSEQEREESENLSDLSQISFVTDALTDVFITDFNFSDPSKDSSKGSKIKNTRRKVGERESKGTASKNTEDSTERLGSQDTSETLGNEGTSSDQGQDITSAKSDVEEEIPSDDQDVNGCDSSNLRLAKSAGNMSGSNSGVAALASTSENKSLSDETAHLDSNENNKFLSTTEEDVNEDTVEEEDYAISTESETDDYKASQKAAAQAHTLATEIHKNKSDDDKGAMIAEQVKSEIMKVSVEEKSETEVCEKNQPQIVSAVTGVVLDVNTKSCKLHPGSDCDCDKIPPSIESDLQKCSDDEFLESTSRSDPQTGSSEKLESSTVPPQEVSRVQRLKYSEINSVAQQYTGNITTVNMPGITDFDWDRESYTSSETSSYTSECQDDEEIALAIQAAELAARREARARFKSSADLIHRLFVCVSGVADQLQTNYASDLRHILKAVFECNASEPYIPIDVATATDNDNPSTSTESQSRSTPTANGTPESEQEISSNEDEPEDEMETPAEGAEEAHENMSASPRRENNHPRTSTGEATDDPEPPKWVPDEQCPHCTGCKVPFTFVRRRHHCRNCGKVFCGRCSANSVPLPHYGHSKPVRVCNHCFMFQVTPFTMD